MKALWERLKAFRKSAWRLVSGGKVISAISHLVLVLAGSLAPAYLAYAVMGKVFAILVFAVCSELWSHFMLAREVADYFKKKAKAVAVEDIDLTWQDGVGDLAGPFLVRIAGWVGVLWLIFGGG